MPGHKSRSDNVLAEAAGHPGQGGGLQIEGLPGLHCELGAATVSHREAVGALGGTERSTGFPSKCKEVNIPPLNRLTTSQKVLKTFL